MTAKRSSRAMASVSRAKATRKSSRQAPRKAPRLPVSGAHTKLPHDVWNPDVIRIDG
jgi:hypothetical protein